MHRSRDAGTWNSIRAAGRGETKDPPRQSARRVSENLLRNSKSSLAVFYVEQVALNRHVSSATAEQPTRRNRSYIIYKGEFTGSQGRVLLALPQFKRPVLAGPSTLPLESEDCILFCRVGLCK